MTIIPEAKELVIGVVGPTGAGKTSLARKLGTLLDLPIYEEDPSGNNFLGKFYQDIKKGNGYSEWAFKSQVWFLEKATDQGRRIKQSGRGAIWDVPPRGHRMYMDLLASEGIMSERERDIYNDLSDALLDEERISLPDIDLVLRINEGALFSRIIERANINKERASETAVNLDYWRRQIKYWEDELNGGNNRNLLAIDAVNLDWVNGSGAEQVWEIIKPHFGL